MPTQIYGDRKLVWVGVTGFAGLKYGFRTNVDAGASTALGHTEVTGAYPAGLAIGVNMPKPPRASKRSATSGKTESSWVDTGSVVSARAAGWKVRPGKRRTGTNTSNTRTCFVTIDGIKYAWRMPLYLFNKVGGVLADLGVDQATAATDGLVFGASYPTPPRARATIVDSGGSSNVSSFVDPDFVDNLPAGWTASGGNTRSLI